jgi:hypothetical protein
MAPIAPPSRAPYDPALYASVGSMADLYDEPMYAAAPHPLFSEAPCFAADFHEAGRVQYI